MESLSKYGSYVVAAWLILVAVGCSIGAVVMWIDRKLLRFVFYIVMALLFGFGAFGIWLRPGPASDPFTVWVALFILCVVNMVAIRFLRELWR